MNPPFFVAVEVNELEIAAGVYDSALHAVGRARRSTKLQRGTPAVLERVTRCILDSVDECDLRLAEIAAVTVGVPGRVDKRGLVTAGSLGWSGVPMVSLLEASLAPSGAPEVLGEDTTSLAALAMHATELAEPPRRFAAVLLGAGVGAGMIEDGQITPAGWFDDLGREAQTALNSDLAGRLKNRSARELRKTARRGDPEALAAAEAVATLAGHAGALVVERFHPDVLGFGGGLVDELRSLVLPIITATLRARLRELPPLMTSQLGDKAARVGGAVLGRLKVLGAA
jgi:predicted NBD/HSP70 family sugar kinase